MRAAAVPRQLENGKVITISDPKILYDEPREPQLHRCCRILERKT